jgi:hypothetical protein
LFINKTPVIFGQPSWLVLADAGAATGPSRAATSAAGISEVRLEGMAKRRRGRGV